MRKLITEYRPTKKQAVSHLFWWNLRANNDKTCFKLSLCLKQAWLTHYKSKDESRSSCIITFFMSFTFPLCICAMMDVSPRSSDSSNISVTLRKAREVLRRYPNKQVKMFFLPLLSFPLDLIVPAFGWALAVYKTASIGAQLNSEQASLRETHWPVGTWLPGLWTLGELKWSYIWNFPNCSALLHRCWGNSLGILKNF